MYLSSQLSFFSDFVTGSYSLQQIHSNPSESLTCEYFDAVACAANQSLCETSQQTCDEPEDRAKRSHCYAFWHYANKSVEGGGGFVENRDVIEVVLKGCWLDTPVCYDRFTCTADDYKNENYFCCCEGSMCNVNMSTNIVINSRTTSTVLNGWFANAYRFYLTLVV